MIKLSDKISFESSHASGQTIFHVGDKIRINDGIYKIIEAGDVELGLMFIDEA